MRIYAKILVRQYDYTTKLRFPPIPHRLFNLIPPRRLHRKLATVARDSGLGVVVTTQCDAVDLDSQSFEFAR